MGLVRPPLAARPRREVTIHSVSGGPGRDEGHVGGGGAAREGEGEDERGDERGRHGGGSINQSINQFNSCLTMEGYTHTNFMRSALNSKHKTISLSGIYKHNIVFFS